jgi:hypothetical protein
MRRDAWRRFASVVPCVFPGSCSLLIAFYAGFAAIGVATLGVDLLVSCCFSGIMNRLRDDRRCDARRRFASVCWFLGSFALYMESWVHVAATGVATLSVDIPVSCLVASVSSCALYVYSFVGVLTLGVGLYRVVWKHLDALGLIWIWSRLCDGRCREAQRQFDNMS